MVGLNGAEGLRQAALVGSEVWVSFSGLTVEAPTQPDGFTILPNVKTLI